MERRTQERYVVRRLRIDGGPERSAPYRVVNLSASGCAVESRGPLDDRGGNTFLDLPLPSKAQVLSLKARVVWLRRLEHDGGATPLLLGLRFEPMDPLSQKILDAYLGYLRRDAHIAQLEQAWEKLKKVQEKIEIMIACEEKKAASYLH